MFRNENNKTTQRSAPDKSTPENKPGESARAPLYVNAQCQHGCGYNEDNKNWVQKLWTDPVASFTGLLFVFTLLLWLATERTLWHARKASEKELRAYVGVQYVFLESPNISAVQWDIPNPAPPGYVYRDFVRVRIMNTGKTPASNVAVFINWNSVAFGYQYPRGEKPPQFITEADIDSASRFILDSGMVSNVTIPIRNSLAPFRAAEQRIESIYFHGFIEYTDIFGVTRRRHFREHWEPWRNEFEDRTTPAREGNYEEEVRKSG